MKKIVFIMYGAMSHINPTIVLARKLQTRGYWVTYAIPPSLENYMQKQGFEYFIHEPFFQPFPLHIHISSMQQLIDFKKQYFEGTIFQSLLKELRPDLIILDTAFINLAIELRKISIPVFIAQLWCSIKKKTNVPPINSEFIPSETLRSKLKVEWLWQSYFLKRKLLHLMHRTFHKTSEFSLLKKKLKIEQLPTSMINFRSYFHIGINFFPELIFPPKQFDFPQEQTGNEIYLGYQIAQDRNNTRSHEKYESLKEKIFEKPTYFYSPGSLLPINKAFIDKLCYIFSSKPDINLIVHVGSNPFSLNGLTIPPNVFVFEGLLPQLEILSRVKLMLTHGGMNSIMECITFEVPMIVVPELRIVDQIGNAARVQFHKIGLAASVHDPIETLIEKIRLMEKDGCYLKNIKAFKESIYRNDGYEPFIKRVDSLFGHRAFSESYA